MKVTILREAGYEEALLGLSLSYGQPVEEMPQVASILYRKDDSESKFLRQICIWLDITAPRYWWQQNGHLSCWQDSAIGKYDAYLD